MPGARDVAVRAARAAGSLILSRASEKVTVNDKGTEGDVVSDLDLASEQVIVEEILRDFPTHQLETEESGIIGDNPDAVWVIDPLDGTGNVALGLPVVAVGIVLCISSVPTVGVIHEPITGRTCSAIRGQGAVFDGAGTLAKISRTRPRNLASPVFAWTQGKSVGSRDPVALACRIALELRSFRLLKEWAPLVTWAMLARGDIDGFVGYRAGSDDLHPGALIASEAGVQIRDLHGDVFDERYYRDEERNFVAASSEVLPNLLATIAASEPLGEILSPELMRSIEPRP
jgi:myo-inositol-1(or 4)-monophosphatase